MIFMTISVIIFVVAALLLGIYYVNTYADWAKIGAALSGCLVVVFIVLLSCFGVESKTNKALMQAHLEKPTIYTYSQLAEHNELVTKLKVWQGTIFSFYNDVDLQTIDIDNISQKVMIEPKNK